MAPALLSKDKKQRPKVASHFKLAEVNMEALNDPLPPHHPGSPKALMIPSLALETLPSEGGQFRPFRNYGEEDRAVTSPAATISNYTSVQSGLMQKETIYYPHVTNGWYNFGLIDTLNALLFAQILNTFQKLAVCCLKLPIFENSMNIDQVSFYCITYEVSLFHYFSF